MGSGEDWLQCTCGKWVHEMCVEDLQLTVTEIQDFAQAALNDNALYILSIIISLLLRVLDTVYKRVVQCIDLYV